MDPAWKISIRIFDSNKGISKSYVALTMARNLIACVCLLYITKILLQEWIYITYNWNDRYISQPLSFFELSQVYVNCCIHEVISTIVTTIINFCKINVMLYAFFSVVGIPIFIISYAKIFRSKYAYCKHISWKRWNFNDYVDQIWKG